MATTPTTPPDITDLSTPPNRLGTSDTVFVAAVDAFFGELPDFGTEQNTLADWEYSTATQVYNNAVEANDSAADSADSAAKSLQYSQESASSANYVGEWADQTGAANKPYSASNNGAIYGLVNNLADVTLSEPSPSNTDWFFISGTRWLSYTANTTITPNSQALLTSTTAATDLNATIPVLLINDFIVVSNSSTSTEIVRLVNNSYTIFGKKGSITSADDLILRAGDTVHLVARTLTILEVV